jgi:hypothetical protein
MPDLRLRVNSLSGETIRVNTFWMKGGLHQQGKSEMRWKMGARTGTVVFVEWEWGRG